MNQYEMMKISDRFDDDGIDECDLNLDYKKSQSAREEFSEEYKRQYSDIKTNGEEW